MTCSKHYAHTIRARIKGINSDFSHVALDPFVVDLELHVVLLEWNHPGMGAREVYAYLACDPKVASELRTLKWEARIVYALAILSDLKMVGFSQFFHEDSGSFEFFDGTILLIGELIDYAVDRASSSSYF